MICQPIGNNFQCYLYTIFYELYLQNIDFDFDFFDFDEFLSIFELQMLIKNIVPMYSYNFLITIRITYEELCIKFSSVFGIQKFFIDTSKKISQKNRKFLWSINNSKKFKIF
ncbi:hypothetical protein FWK35_00003822 [Aphis craccivora]|uniref:Uncharacterized protein n=1 Tax=Aphis craccivora TaxID=307492 RepID=A0A6G0YZC5_APHCR|nr:hypothetical protein FWK35_00003822 [Aphis craccivora]